MRAVVVGAGIAGLASAIRLRAVGYDVHIFEANAYTGGKLTEIASNGYRWDAGPSLFTLPDQVDELFLLMGESPTDHFNYYRHDTACHYFFPDGSRLQAPASINALCAEIERSWNIDGQQVRTYFDRSAKLYRKSGDVFLNSSLHKASTYLKGSTLKTLLGMPLKMLRKSMHAVNEKSVDDPRLVQLFDRYATYNGSNPYEAPAILTMIPHLEFELGTYLPKGGMHEISQSLTRLAKRHGIHIHLNSPVERIAHAAGKTTGVVVDGLKYPADLVVSNCDMYFTYEKLLPDIKAPQRQLKQERSSSAMIFYWGIKKSFPELDLHNILFSRDYQEEFDAIFKRKEIGKDPTVYINITSKLETQDAPAGCENWFVMINCPSEERSDWRSRVAEYRKAVIAKINEALETRIEAVIEAEEILHPGTIQSRTSSHLGALYGQSSNSPFAAFLRHANFSKQLDGLYFVGGSVHPGGGIPLCLKSAKIVSQLASSK